MGSASRGNYIHYIGSSKWKHKWCVLELLYSVPIKFDKMTTYIGVLSPGATCFLLNLCHLHDNLSLHMKVWLSSTLPSSGSDTMCIQSIYYIATSHCNQVTFVNQWHVIVILLYCVKLLSHALLLFLSDNRLPWKSHKKVF